MVRRRHVESATPYLVSLLAHAVLLALIALASRVSPVAPAPEETLSVEIVSEQQIKEAAAPTAPKADLPAKPIEAPPASPPTAPGPEEARLTPPLPQATEPEPRPVEAPPKWHAATKILSAAALSDPRNRQANDILPALQVGHTLRAALHFRSLAADPAGGKPVSAGIRRRLCDARNAAEPQCHHG